MSGLPVTSLEPEAFVCPCMDAGTHRVMLDFHFLRTRPTDECNATGHAWATREYRSRDGFQRVTTCDRCHRTTLDLPSRRSMHAPAHAQPAPS